MALYLLNIMWIKIECLFILRANNVSWSTRSTTKDTKALRKGECRAQQRNVPDRSFNKPISCVVASCASFFFCFPAIVYSQQKLQQSIIIALYVLVNRRETRLSVQFQNSQKPSLCFSTSTAIHSFFSLFSLIHRHYSRPLLNNKFKWEGC